MPHAINEYQLTLDVHRFPWPVINLDYLYCTGPLFRILGCNGCYNRFCKLLCSANISCNHLVHSVFQGSSLSCRNFIGYNFKYGSDFACNYNCGNNSVVREIRDNSLFVHGFDQNMLDVIVCTAHVNSNPVY